MTTDIVVMDWYQSLVDDIVATKTERIFTARWEIICCYHDIGRRLVEDQDYQRYSHGNGKLLSQVSKDTEISERDLYRSIQFFTLYPDLDRLPDGKNISWHKVCNNLLPAGDAKTMQARTFNQRTATIKGGLAKYLDDFPDMPADIKQRVLDLLVLFDERYYDVV